MLELAALYFANPHTSITTQGYKPTPALLRHDDKSNSVEEVGEEVRFVNACDEVDEEYEEEEEALTQLQT